jgi:SAM-dependent methyltransferase/uncharacterized protein YbaR (Trm112 family)
MKQSLTDLLACPRDGSPLSRQGDNLVCGQKHTYPIFEEIPVLLIDDAEQTAPWVNESIRQAKTGKIDTPPKAESSGPIDPYVQGMVAATSGYLYKPLIDSLHEYPIPRLRLPTGSGKTFLDIGCNWGRWSVAAARKGYRVIGIDPNLESTLAARRVTRQLGLDCDFLVADARFLPFKEHSIAVAFSYSVLQHFSKENARASLRSIANVLAPGGVVFIQMPNQFGIRSLYHLIKRGFAPGKGFEVRYWTVRELRKTFEASFGSAEITVDGYFGLGIQASDLHLLPLKYRVIVHASEALRKISQKLGCLTYIADSVYVKCQQPLDKNA